MGDSPEQPLLSGGSADDFAYHSDTGFDAPTEHATWEDASRAEDHSSGSPARSGPSKPVHSSVHLRPRPVGQPHAVRARRTAWICLDTLGTASYIHADKRAVMHMLDLHVPVRDMRLLDFNLISSGKILVRDNALIFSIEHVRLVVSADTVLIPREGLEHNPLAKRCVSRLQRAIASWHAAKEREERALRDAQERAASMQGGWSAGAQRTGSHSAASSAPTSGAAARQGGIARDLAAGVGAPFGTATAGGGAAAAALIPPATVAHRPAPELGHAAADAATAPFTASDPALYPGVASDAEDDTAGLIRLDYELMPFELVVLEVALKEVLAATTTTVKELEAVAMPALDALTRSITSASLERIRKVKTRHQRLLIRCETLRDEMERFLGDDEDMMKMCLTRRRDLEAQRLGAAKNASLGIPGASSDVPGTLPLATTSSLSRRSPFFQLRDAAMSVGGLEQRWAGGGMLAPAPSDEDLVDDMEAVENLLESYYVQIDSLYDKVVSLDEYIKDTEEYINIELDASRNRLIRLEILLTAAAFSMAPFNLLAGILGENLVIPEQLTTGVLRFWEVNGVATTVCVVCFTVVLLYMKRAKLI